MKESLSGSSVWEYHGKIWKTVWALQLPAKIKISSWRIFHNGLPSGSNLDRRGCQVNPSNCICGFWMESTKHALWDCWWESEVWRLMGFSDLQGFSSFMHPTDWLYNSFCRVKVDKFALFLVTSWCIIGIKSGIRSLVAPRSLQLSRSIVR